MTDRIVRICRPDVTAATLSPTCPVAILISGGGFAAWTAKHPTTQFLLRYVPLVYSVLLPYHSHLSAVPCEGTAEEVSESVDEMYELVRPLVFHRYVLLLGYSMGGLYCSRLYPRLLPSIHPHSLVMLVGVALRLGDSGPLIERYWHDLIQHKPHSLIRTHSIHFPTTVRFINAACSQPDSPLFPSSDDRRALRDGEVCYVTGRDDMAYPLHVLRRSMAEEGWSSGNSGGAVQRVWEVDCGHFDYFDSVNWPSVLAALTEMVRLHGRADLLVPSPTSDTGANQRAGKAINSSL